jgi:CubicO group peptidase (beta-lactamase class C family)
MWLAQPALLAALACIPLPASGSTVSPPAAVDAYVRAQMERQHLPGLSLGIVKDGKLVAAKGYGLANVELQVAARPETVYQSGSMGKQFTAMAVMMLVEEGRIHLDDPISLYLPEAPPLWKDITVRHLLTHTAGIKDYAEADAPAEVAGGIDLRRDYTEDELVRYYARFPLDFAPGERWSYSNSGYVLLGVIIRKASRRFYGELLHDRIFAPLGMDTARIITEADIVPNRASGYRLVNGALKNQEWVSPTLNTTADGSLYLTVLDLVKWDAALAAGTLVRRESFEQMWTPVRLNDGTTYPYGFGWSLGTQRGRANLNHGGQWQGFTAHISRFVADHLTVIVLTNLAEGHPGRIAAGVAGLYVPSLQPPPQLPVRKDPDPASGARLRDALAEVAAGRESALVSPRRRAAVTRAAREALAEALTGSRAFAFLAADEVAGRAIERYGQPVSRLVYYRLEGEKGTRDVTFCLTAQGALADWSIEEE